MNILEIFLLLLLFVMLGVGSYIFWINLPSEPVKYQEYSANIAVNSENEGQFYPNMRYRDRRISYEIDGACNKKKSNDITEAFNILSEKTILEFYPSNKEAEIKILCSEIAPEPEEKGHFVAGEGGPSEVINTTLYSVVFTGKISLYRADNCETPQIATHEILHSLGFDHNNNKNSIMYPTTSCNQVLDEYIINKINNIYSAESMPDLAVEKVSANTTGRYLNFEIVVINLGLANSANSTLVLYAEGEKIKYFELQDIDIGTRKVLTVQNVRIPTKTKKISFAIESAETEISKANNNAEIELLVS